MDEVIKWKWWKLQVPWNTGGGWHKTPENEAIDSKRILQTCPKDS